MVRFKVFHLGDSASQADDLENAMQYCTKLQYEVRMKKYIVI